MNAFSSYHPQLMTCNSATVSEEKKRGAPHYNKTHQLIPDIGEEIHKSKHSTVVVPGAAFVDRQMVAFASVFYDSGLV